MSDFISETPKAGWVVARPSHGEEFCSGRAVARWSLATKQSAMATLATMVAGGGQYDGRLCGFFWYFRADRMIWRGGVRCKGNAMSLEEKPEHADVALLCPVTVFTSTTQMSW